MESSGGVGMLVRLNGLMIDDSPVHEEVDEDHSHHDSPGRDPLEAIPPDDFGVGPAHRVALRTGADRDGFGNRGCWRGDSDGSVERRDSLGGICGHRPRVHSIAHRLRPQ